MTWPGTGGRGAGKKQAGGEAGKESQKERSSCVEQKKDRRPTVWKKGAERRGNRPCGKRVETEENKHSQRPSEEEDLEAH
ncbi:hypothetical protein NDU88_003657 [Pleurodeles waltl]|uniref:Uncharacterized protein n=1 Tax=Pleurodeles waltl TaxID=8319 RepID=A0AAV7VGN6_PLEWA|nr:hypothetical protein NDU88_003657 [Pleurodeles waltl]